MRITQALKFAVLTLALAIALPAAAQDSTPKGDAEVAPDGQAQNFGPRKKSPQTNNRPPQPKVENVALHGAWQIQCVEAPAKQDGSAGGKTCGMIQQGKSEKSEKIALSVIVNKVNRGDKSATFMRIMAPIGVYLPTGVPVEIDGAALPSRMIFTRCVPPICEAMGEMSPETLGKFKKGGASTFFLYDRPGNGFPIKISLEGFAAALGELEKQ